MKNTKRVVLAVAVLFVVSVVAPAFAAADVTVGSFLQEIAKLNNLPAQDGREAMTSLRAAGMNIPAMDTRKALTEGDVLSISEVVGLNLSTKDPSALFTQAQVDDFLGSFGSEFDTNDLAQNDDGLPGDDEQARPEDHAGGNGKGADPLTKGKGKKKGHDRSPSEPE